MPLRRSVRVRVNRVDAASSHAEVLQGPQIKLEVDPRDPIRTPAFVYCQLVCELGVIFVVYAGNEFAVPVPKRRVDGSGLELHTAELHRFELDFFAHVPCECQ